MTYFMEAVGWVGAPPSSFSRTPLCRPQAKREPVQRYYQALNIAGALGLVANSSLERRDPVGGRERHLDRDRALTASSERGRLAGA